MKYAIIFLGIINSLFLSAQTIIPDITDKSKLDVYNREVLVSQGEEDKTGSIEFNAKPGDGLAVIKNIEFENGTIEFDVKGKDVLQRSFVGVAFHIQDENTFNAIYFRPFNFKKPERAGHSVQYICHPEFTWQKLRTDFPEQFENPVTPVPNPENWFHAKIEIEWPGVKVYVENSNKPSLDVTLKSTYKKGKVGFWVGNGSDGSFKNLRVTKK